MENKVVEVINALCEKIGLTIDWTSQNVIPYIKELINRFIKYEIATSVFYICFFLTLAICTFFIAKSLHKKTTEDDWYYEKPIAIFTIIAWVLFVAFTITCLILIPIQTLNIIECATIPEKVIIDYLTSQTAC